MFSSSYDIIDEPPFKLFRTGGRGKGGMPRYTIVQHFPDGSWRNHKFSAGSVEEAVEHFEKIKERWLKDGRRTQG